MEPSLSQPMLTSTVSRDIQFPDHVLNSDLDCNLDNDPHHILYSDLDYILDFVKI